MALVVKNPPANAGCPKRRGVSKIPGRGHAAHSSLLAWRIPWTEEPGWLESTGSQRIRQDLVLPGVWKCCCRQGLGEKQALRACRKD